MKLNQFEEAIFDAGIPGIIRSTVRRDGTRTGAVYSLEQRRDGHPVYRYVLWWVWGSSLPVWLYALLNPSTATHIKLDPTLTRCAERARRNGAGGICIVNSGGIRETDSKVAVRHADPIGPHNHLWIKLVSVLCDMHIVGYGPMAKRFGGDVLLQDIFLDQGIALHRLELSKAGIPKHPLYTSYDVKPVPFTLC